MKNLTLCPVCRRNSLFWTITPDKFGEEGIERQDLFIPGHQQLFAGSGHGDIEFAVDRFAIRLETVGGKEVELVGLLDGEAVDDDITLTALVTLHRIDGDIHKGRNIQPFYLPADHRYLVTVGNDDPHRP